MIRIGYAPDPLVSYSNFNKNAVVIDPLSCELRLGINSVWELTLEHPYDEDEKYQKIQKMSLLEVDIPIVRELTNNKQMFIIKSVNRALTGVTAIAFPLIFEWNTYKLIDSINSSSQYTVATALGALQALFKGSTALALGTDISADVEGDIFFENTNLIEVINGEDETSLVNRTGAELVYDNNRLFLSKGLGAPNNNEILYGKNITDSQYEENTEELTTRFYPISSDGVRYHSAYSSGNAYIDSSHINDYGRVYSRYLEIDAPLIQTDNDGSGTYTTTQGVLDNNRGTVETRFDAVARTFFTYTGQSIANFFDIRYVLQYWDSFVAWISTDSATKCVNASVKDLIKKSTADALNGMKENNLFIPETPDWHKITLNKTGGGTVKTKYFGTADGTIKYKSQWIYDKEGRDFTQNTNRAGWVWVDANGYAQTMAMYDDFAPFKYNGHNYYGSEDYWSLDMTYFDIQTGQAKTVRQYCRNQMVKSNDTWVKCDANGYSIINDAILLAFKDLSILQMKPVKDNAQVLEKQLFDTLYFYMERAVADEYANGADVPLQSISLGIVDLTETQEYSDLKISKYCLGDTVKCTDAQRGISTTGRVVEITYDCIRNETTNVVIGKPRQQMAYNTINKIVDSIPQRQLVAGSGIRINGNSISLRMEG